MEESLRFYRDQLGFEVVGTAKMDGSVYWCRIRRGGACLMLQQADGAAENGSGSRDYALYLVCEEADRIFTELQARGLELDPPSIAEYGMKQLFVPEPDGRTLVFESPTADWAG